MATSAAREQYLASQRNQKTMKDVSRIAEQEGRALMSVASTFDQQTFGGYVRTVLPGFIDKYGQLNQAAAIEYYDSQRMAAMLQLQRAGDTTYNSTKNINRRATNLAKAKTRGAIALANSYSAVAPALDTTSKVDSIVGFVMNAFTGGGYESAQTSFVNSSLREIAMANRDTVMFNATLDSSIRGVQRVAEPNACAFCMMIALGGGYSSNVGNYAADYHNNCHCSIEPIFYGQEAIRPDYYDQFQEDYNTGKENQGDGVGITPVTKISGQKITPDWKKTLQGVRKQTGRS